MTDRPTIVVSLSRSRNPAKRDLQDAIVARMAERPDVEVRVLPELSDVADDSPSVAALRAATGHLIVLAWLYPRAAFWILDRHGVQGRFGQTEEPRDEEPRDEEIPSGAHRRLIHCLDLREADDADQLVGHIGRLLAQLPPLPSSPSHDAPAGRVVRIDDADGQPTRRWYPVVDFARCTQCMECIDFCLFGVYDVDDEDRLFVEMPDDCRVGCPACSRVCPAGAIMFPRHKSTEIAGGPPGDGGTGKLDLSELFAGLTPEQAKSRAERLAQTTETDGQADAKDELDELIDRSDEFDA